MQALSERVNQLIEQGNDLIDETHHYPNYDVARMQWVMSCQNFFEFAKLTRYLQEFQRIRELPLKSRYLIPQMVGIVQSARDEIEAGFIAELKHLIHAEFFGSIIEQAEELLDKGYKMPAAVLGRIIMERWLKDEAEKNNIALNSRDKASKINDLLKQGGYLPVPKWRQVQSFLDVGNSAAHGNNDEFDDDDAKRMFSFIKANCL